MAQSLAEAAVEISGRDRPEASIPSGEMAFQDDEIDGGSKSLCRDVQHLAKGNGRDSFKNGRFIESLAGEAVNVVGRKPKTATGKLQSKIEKRRGEYVVRWQSSRIGHAAIFNSPGTANGGEQTSFCGRVRRPSDNKIALSRRTTDEWTSGWSFWA